MSCFRKKYLSQRLSGLLASLKWAIPKAVDDLIGGVSVCLYRYVWLLCVCVCIHSFMLLFKLYNDSKTKAKRDELRYQNISRENTWDKGSTEILSDNETMKAQDGSFTVRFYVWPYVSYEPMRARYSCGGGEFQVIHLKIKLITMHFFYFYLY